PAIALLNPAVVIVDICDDPRYFRGQPPWTHELLSRCLRQADIVTTSSRALEAEFKERDCRNVHYLPNGVHARTLLHKRSNGRPATRVLGFLGHPGPWV